MKGVNLRVMLPALPVLLTGAGMAFAQGGASDAKSAQLAVGEAAYAANCAVCHGEALAGGQFAPALKGQAFQQDWAGATARQIHDYIRSSMPPGNTGSLDAASYAALTAYVLDGNGAELSGPIPIGGDLASAVVPAFVADGRAVDELGVSGLSSRVPVAAWPARPDRFAGFTPLTEKEISNPDPEDWLSWRRSHQGLGYSPLAQIDRSNVKTLRMAWSRALPPGVNMNEPLVRDGVLYVLGFGDEVFAFDAANGDVLWRYRRDLPDGTVPNSKKTLALYGDKLFTATSDNHMLALDARTGRPVWDVVMTDIEGFRNPGGPLAADGVVMQGLTTQNAGGGLIVAFDADSGEKLWSFNTVAQPGTPGGDTWNGLPANQRRGGSVWTSGTYDEATGLALWGVAQSYDTGPLLHRKEGENNDGLYTDSTLAFEPRTGRLVWYFQHMKNDQWDLDWVFDRVIGTIEVGGKPRRVVMTSGKEGLFDTIDLETGRYLRTLDMGIQNFVTGVDPRTGDKIIDPAKYPRPDERTYVCPHAGGGRNWGPTSFNPDTKRLFVVARNVCMDMVPAQNGFLSSGVNIEYAAPPNDDGRYGVLQALDMQGNRIAWDVRQRAPFNTGVLTTAGGLLFAGSVDRQVMAYDQDNGQELWRTGLAGVPNASPISFAVDGKQYVAIVTGYGNPLAFGLSLLTPEIEAPPVNSSEIYVFALPD